MKTSHLFLTALLVAGPGLVARAAEQPAPNSRVQVNFFEPEKFTDINSSSLGTERDTAYQTRLIRDYVVQQASRKLPAGQKLEITFTDIDLAGAYEPWRGSPLSEVRIVKEIYPPRMDFTFRITDAAGAVVKEGKRSISDLNFLMKIPTAFRDDPLRHEKTLLDDWLSSELASTSNRT